MTRREHHLAAVLAIAALPALAPLAQTGCASKPTAIPSRHANARSWSGQLHLTKNDRTTIGTFAARSSGPDDFALDFFTGPGVIFLRVEVRGSSVRSSGPLARGTRKEHWLILAKRFSALDPHAPSLDIALPRGETFRFRLHSPR